MIPALLVGVNLLDVHTPGKFASRIKEAAERLPKGEWITRGDWGAYELWDKGNAGKGIKKEISKRFKPDRNLIDKYTPDNPVLINRFDRKYYLANSLALRLAGIDETTDDPGFLRDETGRLTGLMTGKAASRIRKVIPQPSFEENIKGTIEEGKLADIVVLDKNLFEIEPLEILKTKVLYTIMDGKIVYQRN